MACHWIFEKVLILAIYFEIAWDLTWDPFLTRVKGTAAHFLRSILDRKAFLQVLLRWQLQRTLNDENPHLSPPCQSIPSQNRDKAAILRPWGNVTPLQTFLQQSQGKESGAGRRWATTGQRWRKSEQEAISSQTTWSEGRYSEKTDPRGNPL